MDLNTDSGSSTDLRAHNARLIGAHAQHVPGRSVCHTYGASVRPENTVTYPVVQRR